jgi:hypothetical protein
MTAFAYSNSPYPIRTDLTEAYRHAWQKLAEPGNWWSGGARVAIAQEVRNATNCSYCAQRKTALSPFAPIEGEHDTSAALAPNVIDVVHRLTTDPSRLTKTWLDETTANELTVNHYVEIISVVVTTLYIDSFHRALGFELEPLPIPQKGEPSRYVPDGLETKTAWVPMIDTLCESEQDLWSEARTANVMRAMSLVPDAVRLLKTLSAAQYVGMQDVPNPAADGGRAISRAQIEFIAARVSAINDCFY